MFKILSFDGGGILGLYSARLLRRLVDLYPRLIADTNLIAGTSTGGLIALCLAAGVSPQAIESLYQTKASEIFQRNSWSPFNLLGAKYKADGMIAVARSVFGHSTLGTLRKRVVVPAFDLKTEASPANSSWRCTFFHNLGDSDYMNERCMDVAIRTSAAPTYFPQYQGYIDGAVAANDPSMVAVGLAAKSGFSIGDIAVLSIGTGGQIRYVDGQDKNWGAIGWVKPIIGILMGAQEITTDWLCKSILGGRYCRLNPTIPGFEMDDLSTQEELIRLADAADLRETGAFLETHWT